MEHGVYSENEPKIGQVGPEIICLKCIIIPPPTVVAGGIIFYPGSFFLFFSFAAGYPRWLYQQGTFLAQMVGYRCNFKNWVENLGATPH